MQYDFKKKSERKRFYKSNVWRGVNGVRNQVIKRDRECQWCKRDGLVTTGDMGTLEVDHIIELEHGTYQDAINLDNLRTLCKHHHNQRHNRFDGRTCKAAEKKFDDEKW